MIEDRAYRLSHVAHYQSVIDDAHRIVRDCVARYPGQIAVAVSGGKDSVSMAHIVAQYCDPLVIWNDSGLELPESEGVVRAVCDQLGLELAVATGDALNIKLDKGRYNAHRTAAGTDNLAIIGPVRKVIQECGVVLEFVGLRSSESRTRRIVITKIGPVYQSKRWGCAVAWPMRRWDGSDSLAYIDEHGLPLHPAYDREWGKSERHERRVSWLWDSNRERWGEFEYLRRFYPLVWARLQQEGII